MNKNNNKIDWSEDVNKEMLVYQRKSLWPEDTLDKLAVWLGLKHGMTAVDVGCGLGYLGYTYWKYFGNGGKYIGIDNTDVLLEEASQSANKWAIDGIAEFIKGDAYNLPLADNCADFVMCQTLLLHLEKPEIVINEMTRVVKPGGLVICHEPANLNGMTNKPVWSLPEFSLEEELLLKKNALICHKGRIKLGHGDNQIGTKVPFMMKKAGLNNIGIRTNDQVTYLEPPYETNLQKIQLEKLKKFFLDKKSYDQMLKSDKEEYFAGGGTDEEYEKILKISNKIRNKLIKQLQNNEYSCCSGSTLYIIKGIKQK